MKYLLTGVISLCFFFMNFAQEINPFIIVDQFGYLPTSTKIAVLKDPQIGFDEEQSYTPGESFQLINESSGESVLSGSPVAWKNGATDASSGDKAWHFDFSSIDTPGKYHVLDVTNNQKSYSFEIGESVYSEALKHAFRTFYYQRAGFEKKLPFADTRWEDDASHIGADQDTEARSFLKKNDFSLERDVSGGWYDAGDYNKYTNWTANYVVELIKMYRENPNAWGDNFNIPESGNGISDLLDEVKWGLDHLINMQEEDGGVLSIVGMDHDSPPSKADGPSYYGDRSTSASLNTAGAFAISAIAFQQAGLTDYAASLQTKAEMAWDWAIENPDVIFYNNSSANGTQGLGAGQQEVDDYGRLMAKIEAAVFLFELTGEETYKSFIDNNYTSGHLMEWSFAYPFELANQEALLHYSNLPNATTSVANNIQSTYTSSINSASNYGKIQDEDDPYGAFLDAYTWGSNGVKAAQGLMYIDNLTYDIDQNESKWNDAGELYIHYLHGVNPLNIVYLSNMYEYGAENCVNEFYHSWFANNSTKWDRVGESEFGPAPGFLVGGPNPSYDWDGCCPANCGSGTSNAVCTSESLVPPKEQPKQKSYKDFNTSWPLNSWSVTENSNGYQVNYLRLLSKFVDGSFDCHGTKDGSAYYDVCGNCVGGETGNEPIENEADCTPLDSRETGSIEVYPNPTTGIIAINSQIIEAEVTVYDAVGNQIVSGIANGSIELDLSEYKNGTYLMVIKSTKGLMVRKVVKI